METVSCTLDLDFEKLVDTVTMECQICEEVCNKSSRKACTCSKCQDVFCRQCMRQSLLNTVNDPACPSCKHPLDALAIKDTCGISWFGKEYKAYRRKVLLDREKAKIQGDMAIVGHYKQHIEANEQAVLLSKKVQELRNRITDIHDTIAQLHRLSARHHNVVFGVKARAHHWEFNHPCPFEGCNGFLSKVGKCPVCENWTCMKCFELKGKTKDAEHTCKDENKASAEHIKKHTKRCPECGVPCVRISGCTQMWCPQCHTSFSYRTGEVYKKAVHNPEREKWIREGMTPATRKRKSADVGGATAPSSNGTCDQHVELVPYWEFNRINAQMRGWGDGWGHGRDVYSATHHLEGLMRRLRAKIRNYTTTKKLRLDFAIGHIDQTTLAAKLEQKERFVHHYQQVYNVLELLYQVMVEAINDFVHAPTFDKAIALIETNKRMVAFTQKRFEEICAKNKLRVPNLRGDFFRL